jgi:hypothetical protein
MITWLNLTSGVRLARNERALKFGLVAIGFAACFILAMVF